MRPAGRYGGVWRLGVGCEGRQRKGKAEGAGWLAEYVHEGSGDCKGGLTPAEVNCGKSCGGRVDGPCGRGAFRDEAEGERVDFLPASTAVMLSSQPRLPIQMHPKISNRAFRPGLRCVWILRSLK